MINVNKNTAKRAHRILEIAARMAREIDGNGWQVRNQLEEINLNFEGYAEPGYSEPECGIVATGNWNTITQWKDNQRSEISDLPKRIGDLFEKMGIECEWGDEWYSCGCGKLVRTSADSYSWQPSYWMGDGEIMCVDCVEADPSGYLEAHEENEDSCITIKSIDPADHGYIKMNDAPYESGWHPGQNDDPAKVAKELRAKGIERFLFLKDENSQFYSRWSVYVHESQATPDESNLPIEKSAEI